MEPTSPAPPSGERGTPAASLVVFRRSSAGGPPELLFLVRSAAMRFAASATVFPGGRVDEADRALAQARFAGSVDLADTASRIAAIRETLEEAGLAIGVDRAVSAGEAAEARELLLAEGALAPVLDRFDWSLDLARLTPFARWNPNRPRAFDTRFYLADLGTGAVDLAVDGTEHGELMWLPAGDALARAWSGELRMLFPTRCNLERLAQYADFAQACADSARWPQPTIVPWVDEVEGRPWIFIPDGIGFPVHRMPLDEAVRD